MAEAAFEIPAEIETPAVLVDVDRLDRNIRTWSESMRTRGVGLRPHTKTSKCIPIIRRQVDAGVVGLTVATLGEAEVLADAGFDDLFQAFPLWAGLPRTADRLRSLHDRVRLTVGVESASSAAALGAAVRGASRRLPVLIEVDSGMHRSGVSADDVVRVARAADDAGLEVRGAFTFGGHGYASCDAVAGAGDDEVQALAMAADLLDAAGFPPVELSAGSTPTAVRSARPPVTDERPGSYVFHDAQQVALGAATIDDVALAVAATVVASHADGRFVIDAGSKVLAADRPPSVRGHGIVLDFPDAELRSLSEHHGVAWTTGPRPDVGDRVVVVPNHCCVVVNLVDTLTVVRDGEVVDLWPVVGRGRNH